MCQIHTMLQEGSNLIGRTQVDKERGAIPARLSTLGPIVLAGQWERLQASPHHRAPRGRIDSASLEDHSSALKDGSKPDLLTKALEVGAPLRRSLRICPEKMMTAAIPEMARLSGLIRPAGYVVRLTDRDGQPLTSGGHGTLPVPSAVLHTSAACSAPICDPDGEIAAMLAAMPCDGAGPTHSYTLVLRLVSESALAIEERLFRDRFAQNWIIAIARSDNEAGACLFSFDKGHRIIGADRHSRSDFTIGQEQIDAGLCLWKVFARSGILMHPSRYGSDMVTSLRLVREESTLCAIISPPVAIAADPENGAAAYYLLRPRRAMLTELKTQSMGQPSRGGLSASALRRAVERVESQFAEPLRLEVLAADARLSKFHFLRAFKQSLGISPYQYVLQQRVRKAEELLVLTDMDLVDIAAAVGFADQSHLSRHFRRLVGDSPRHHRRSRDNVQEASALDPG
jgi:AraC-like DNA-binding protein